MPKDDADMTAHTGIWGLERAKKEPTEAAKWARQCGFDNVAPRLEFASRLIQEEINKRDPANNSRRRVR